MGYAEPPVVPDEDGAIEKSNADLALSDRVTRQEAAVGLRIAGANYSDIARTLGYASATLARQAVERSLASSAGPESKEQLRFIESRRLERLLRGLWKKATDEDNAEHLAATRTAIAVIDRHARLNGLDAPTEHIVYNPASEEIDKWVTLVANKQSGEMPEEVDVIDSEIVDDGVGDEA